MKYAVIFRATVNEFDDNYSQIAEKLRSIAFEQYNCQDFVATTEGDQEVAISYWNRLEDIQAWKADITHLYAQKIGQEKWYKNYQVDVVEIVKSYSSN